MVPELLIAKATDRSLDIYLKAIAGSSAGGDLDDDELLKIGQLAKAVDETVATIRYWTKEGLLSVTEITGSGYALYSSSAAILQVGKIRSLQQQQRLTIREIRAQLDGE